MPRCNPELRKATAEGLPKFWSETPCKNGHIGWRKTPCGSCLQCRKERPRKYFGDTPESKAAYMRAGNKKFYAENREVQIQRALKFKRENPGLNTQHERKRQAAKLQRVPKWADLEAIKLFYKNCPAGMTVDHIIPLQGKIVSGLHVANNLQYLTRKENAAKNNHFDPEQVC